jgi:hypothetical protein
MPTDSLNVVDELCRELSARDQTHLITVALRAVLIHD